MQKSFIIDVWEGSKYASGLNFIQFTLHEGLKRFWIKPLSLRSWQNFKTLAGKLFSSVSKYLYFSWEFPEYNTLFSKSSPGRLLLKLIYWNKSMQIINIINTTNEQPGTTLNNDREIPKKTAMRRMCDFKKVNITLWPGCLHDSCFDIVRSYSFCFETSAEKSPWA